MIADGVCRDGNRVAPNGVRTCNSTAGVRDERTCCDNRSCRQSVNGQGITS